MNEEFKNVVGEFKTRLFALPDTIFAGDSLTPTHEKFFTDGNVRSLFLEAANGIKGLSETGQITEAEDLALSKDCVRTLKRRMTKLELTAGQADDILCKLADVSGISDNMIDALIEPALK
jgi:hypothetical protein